MTNSLPTPDSSAQPLSVSIWEGIAITAGAVMLVAIGLAGLAIKALNNAFDPRRAEAIASSIIEYEIPGGSMGMFGANVGGAKVAVIASSNPPDGIPKTLADGQIPPPAIELLVARIPVSQETGEIEPQSSAANEFFAGFSFSYQTEGAFQIMNTRVENKEFCGTVAPVTIQKGILTLPDQTTRLAAVKYDVQVIREADSYVAILSTVGDRAEADANQVFESLECSTITIAPQSLIPSLFGGVQG
ncbi:MAG: hypothetical protein HC769_26460 [Cyanobacteria bacterium CRU_2_1]|nr:hypothetical protein [Cyanobacteria bacterium RU_5_0]NJR62055.1 hypothetical protein [Cyanobacteria bacterium CRU_2_1]